jgi:hypothetical protein
MSSGMRGSSPRTADSASARTVNPLKSDGSLVFRMRNPAAEPNDDHSEEVLAVNHNP